MTNFWKTSRKRSEGYIGERAIAIVPPQLGDGAVGTFPRQQIIDTVIRVSAVLQQCERIADIEINPLMVYDQGEGVKAVDARILVA